MLKQAKTTRVDRTRIAGRTARTVVTATCVAAPSGYPKMPVLMAGNGDRRQRAVARPARANAGKPTRARRVRPPVPPLPHRPDRVDDEPRRQIETGRDASIARRAGRQLRTGARQLRAGSAMDRAADTAAGCKALFAALTMASTSRVVMSASSAARRMTYRQTAKAARGPDFKSDDRGDSH